MAPDDDPGNTRTRFIKDRKERVRQRPEGGHYVVSAVFMPTPAKDGPYAGRLEHSTFRVDELLPEEVWQLGFDHYLPSERTLRGRADIPTRQFLNFDLSFVPQVPPPRHGSFIDWPDEETEQLSIAVALAAKASAYPHPDGKDLLFRLSEDPFELEDVSAEHPDVAERLRNILLARIERHKARRNALGSTGSEQDVDPAIVEQLRALGYVQ